MYNTDIPNRAELPSTRQLIRSTLIAAVAAVVLLFTVVLPAEYGVDPTGIGRTLGLTEMGEIKTRLAREAEEDAAATLAAHSAPAAATTPGPVPAEDRPSETTPSTPATPSQGPAEWRDEITFVLTPGQGTEIKLRMNQGDRALYAWTVEGGVVNYDTHGDAPGRSISYVKGRAVPSDEGELVAAFSGNHGWFWRNRGVADVTVVLRTGGTYSEIKRIK